MSCCHKNRPQDAVASPPRFMRRGVGFAPESLISQQRGGAESAGAQPPLGSNTKSVDQRGRESWRKAQRLLDFSHQRTAARLLPDERVCGCRWAVISRQHGVEVALTTYEDGTTRAGYGGLQVCGSVWLCPCCGKRISEVRRGELNALLAWARSVGLVPVMLTLTARHRQGNDLGAAARRDEEGQAADATAPRVAGDQEQHRGDGHGDGSDPRGRGLARIFTKSR